MNHIISYKIVIVSIETEPFALLLEPVDSAPGICDKGVTVDCALDTLLRLFIIGQIFHTRLLNEVEGFRLPHYLANITSMNIVRVLQIFPLQHFATAKLFLVETKDNRAQR